MEMRPRFEALLRVLGIVGVIFCLLGAVLGMIVVLVRLPARPHEAGDVVRRPSRHSGQPALCDRGTLDLPHAHGSPGNPSTNPHVVVGAIPNLRDERTRKRRATLSQPAAFPQIW